MTMKWLSTILASSLLMACGGNVGTVEPARYDFGGLTGSGPRLHASLAAVEVRAMSWLAGTDMHFRLDYAEPLRRRAYAESRWVAPPGELLQAFLKRRMASDPPESGGVGCRLRLVLDELEQRFDDTQHSRVVLEVRATLSPPRGPEMLSTRVFQISKQAGTADARGGAAAARAAAQTLADDISGWLGEISRDKPATIERCRTY